MRMILGALTAIVLLTGVAASQPAEARCFWNGVAMECFHHPHWGYWHRPFVRDFGPRPYWWGGY